LETGILNFDDIQGETMKRIICLVLLLGLVVMFGCAQEKPEAAAKKIFEQQVAGHEGLELDTSGLVYTIADRGDDTAVVEVSGKIVVKAAIPLEKKGGQWVLAVPDGEPAAKEAKPHQ
jgi:hypothetical protein